MWEKSVEMWGGGGTLINSTQKRVMGKESFEKHWSILLGSHATCMFSI